jgi:acyl-coenzyme A thioesterase PaaI-like protein
VADALSDAEQFERRAWFRNHWQNGVAFIRHCGICVERWDDTRVELYLPCSDGLSAHNGIFGGTVSALLDTTATGAVMAGHDYNRGSRVTTISLSVQYLSVAQGRESDLHRDLHPPGPPGELR